MAYDKIELFDRFKQKYEDAVNVVFGESKGIDVINFIGKDNPWASCLLEAEDYFIQVSQVKKSLWIIA